MQILSIMTATISGKTKIKFREPIFSYLFIVPTKPLAHAHQRHVTIKTADWSRARLASGLPSGKSLPKRSGAVAIGRIECHAEINKRLLIGQVRYRLSSVNGPKPTMCKTRPAGRVRPADPARDPILSGPRDVPKL